MVKSARFQDDGSRVGDFVEECLVICPRCQKCAIVLPMQSEQPKLSDPRRVSCIACGYHNTWERGAMQLGTPFDPYFHLPLWLQKQVGAEILWFYNWRHMNYIESYVQATMRTRHPNPQMGWINRSQISRLPRWIKLAKNRDLVLHAIRGLREKA